MKQLLQLSMACTFIAGCFTMIHQLPDCSAVSCIAPVCNGFYTPLEECCPICPSKKGSCPFSRGKRLRQGLCWVQCMSDYDYFGALKCCWSGCGNLCMPPRFSRCEVKGVNYEEGVIVPSKTANPCESCICRNGSVQCTIMICLVCEGITPPGQCCPICRGRPD